MKILKIETLILFTFLGCIAFWGASKCSSKRSDLVRRLGGPADEEREERPMRRDTVALPQPAPAQQPPAQQLALPQKASPAPAENSTSETKTAAPAAKLTRPTLSKQPGKEVTSAPPPLTTKAAGSTLFVSIEGLKVRATAGLKGETVATLKLYEPVTFLNQKTEWTQEISLGYEKVTDHWVKIRTQSGKEGWVFGAGVHYYKMKRKGVQE